MEERKLLRVELEWDDGEIMYLEGEQAEAWDAAVRGQGALAWVHGQQFPQLNWKKTYRPNIPTAEEQK